MEWGLSAMGIYRQLPAGIYRQSSADEEERNHPLRVVQRVVSNFGLKLRQETAASKAAYSNQAGSHQAQRGGFRNDAASGRRGSKAGRSFWTQITTDVDVPNRDPSGDLSVG